MGPTKSISPRNRFGDPETGGTALVGGMIHITSFAIDQRVDQRIQIHFVQLQSPSRAV
jgi:hypothetical protein